MRIDTKFAWSVRHISSQQRYPVVRQRIETLVQKYGVKAIVMTHGRRWRMTPSARKRLAVGEVMRHASFVDLEDVCDLMESPRNLRSVAQRIADSYPEVRRYVESLLGSKLNPRKVRDARPILSALAVAHAASVQHLIKFG
jgi:hypothetical protein